MGLPSELEEINHRLSQEIAQRKQMEQLLHNQLRFEDKITQIAKHFILLEPHKVDEGINYALQQIGLTIAAARGYVFMFQPGTDVLVKNTHEWCAEGVAPKIADPPPSNFMAWLTEKTDHSYFSTEALPSEQESLIRFNFSGRAPFLFVPMVFRDQVIGFVGFDDIQPGMEETKLMTLLVIIAEVFVLAFERRDAEQALLRSKAELEARVEERTAELTKTNDWLQQKITEQQNTEHLLREANAKAEVANIAKAQFLANVGHEMRTPLTSIRESLHTLLLLRNDIPQEEMFQFINNSYNSACHLNDLIENILDFSQMNTGHFSVVTEGTFLHPILQSVWPDLEQAAAKKQISLKLHCPEEFMPEVIVDEKRLRQIFFNLVGNAIKFTPSEGIVGIHLLPHSEKELLVLVEDSGMGIPLEFRPKVFERFSRADNSGKIRGTGIGLAITKQLVEAMNGSIWFESEVGKGTKFYFTLPLHS